LKNSSLLFKALEFYGTKVPHRGKWWTHLQLRKLLRADCDFELEVTREGLKWLLNPSDYAQSEFFWLGAYEYWDTYHFIRLLHPGDEVFDVGANFGYYSIAVCKSLKQNCRVHAFEPNPTLHARLNKNVELNAFGGQIETHLLGLSDTEGRGYLASCPGHSGTARLAPIRNGTQVSLSTLDHFCQVHNITRLDFIKIDVEGFEERVLRGGTRSISEFRPSVFVEFHPAALMAEGSSIDRVVGMLRDYGYSLYVARRRRLVPIEGVPTSAEPSRAFCFPREAACTSRPEVLNSGTIGSA
jgi:FkbM family methyltransferase